MLDNLTPQLFLRDDFNPQRPYRLTRHGSPARRSIVGRLGTNFGWGSLQISEADESGTFDIEVTNSPLAAAYGESRLPVCHLLRGVLAGIAEVLLEFEVNAVETRCSASDTDGERNPCIFRIAPEGTPLRFRGTS